MRFIWYNPDLEEYEIGELHDYHVTVSTSPNKDRFEVVYEMEEDENPQLGQKIVSRLNKARAWSAAY